MPRDTRPMTQHCRPNCSNSVYRRNIPRQCAAYSARAAVASVSIYSKLISQVEFNCLHFKCSHSQSNLSYQSQYDFSKQIDGRVIRNAKGCHRLCDHNVQFGQRTGRWGAEGDHTQNQYWQNRHQNSIERIENGSKFDVRIGIKCGADPAPSMPTVCK